MWFISDYEWNIVTVFVQYPACLFCCFSIFSLGLAPAHQANELRSIGPIFYVYNFRFVTPGNCKWTHAAPQTDSELKNMHTAQLH